MAPPSNQVEMMRVARIVIQNFRTFALLDVNVADDFCCIIGENNTGKTAILRAIQLCLDNMLPSSFRSLLREDIHAAVDIAEPSQVLIGIELTGFEGRVNEEALVSTWKTAADRARIFYRFRPRPAVREQFASGDIAPGTLTLEDYQWEIRGGGDPAIDLTEITWDDEGIGEAVRFADLQAYLLVHLPALRDVENDLRNPRQSPLIRLIEAFEIDAVEQEALIAILDQANQAIANSATIAQIAVAIDARFKDVSGPAFEMDATLGLSAATFRAIIRNLKIILSDLSLTSFEPGRNGLGMNNMRTSGSNVGGVAVHLGQEFFSLSAKGLTNKAGQRELEAVGTKTSCHRKVLNFLSSLHRSAKRVLHSDVLGLVL